MKKLLTDKDFTNFEIELPAHGSQYIYLNGFSANKNFNPNMDYDINVTANGRNWSIKSAKVIYLDDEGDEKRYRFSSTDFGSNANKDWEHNKPGTGAIKRKTSRMLRPE